MIPKRIFFGSTILTALTLFSCAPNPNRPMGNWGHMMGYGYGGGFMWILFLALIAVVIYILLQSSKSKDSNGSVIETPLDILKKRYAKGEINKEEFDRMKKDIEAS